MMISDSGLLFWATLYVYQHMAEVYAVSCHCPVYFSSAKLAFPSRRPIQDGRIFTRILNQAN